MAVDIADMYESTETTVAEALALAQMAREKALNTSRHVSGTCAETTISLMTTDRWKNWVERH